MKIFGIEIVNDLRSREPRDRGTFGLTMGELLGGTAERAFGVDTPEARAFFSASEQPGSDIKILSKKEAFDRVAFVHKCVCKNAEMIASLPFILRRGETNIEKHQLLDLIRNPNPYMTEADLWFMTIATLNLYGEAFWLLNRASYDGITRAEQKQSVLSYPKSIWTVHPKNVEAVLSKDRQTLVAWRVTLPGAGQSDVDPLDVVQFRFMNPFNQWRGSSPLDAAALAISGEYASQAHNLGIFARGAIPAGVLVTDGKLNPQQADVIIAKFEARHRDPGRPAILHSGLDYKETQMSNHDMEFKTLREMDREEILAVFGVPPVAVGLLAHASYANAEMQGKLYWEGTLIPQSDLIANTVRKHLMRGEQPNLIPVFDKSGVTILQDDLSKKMSVAKDLFALSYTPNMINERLSLGMPKLPWGDVGLLSFSLAPAENVINPPEPEPPVDPNGGFPDDDEGEIEDDDEAEEPKPKKKKEEPKELVNAFSWNKIAGEMDRILLKRDTNSMVMSAVNGKPVVLMTSQEAQKLETAEDINAAIESRLRRASVMQTVIRVTDKKLTKILSIIEKDKKELKKLAETYMKQAFTVGVEQIDAIVGTNFGIDSEEAVDFIKMKVLKIVGIEDTTKEWIRKVVADGIADGLTNEELADKIREDYNFGSERALRIARTETSSAVNGARFLAMQEEKIEEHEWLTSRGPKVRETHLKEEGKIVKIGERFPNTHLRFPGDPDGVAAEIINCQCIALPGENRRKFQVQRDAYWDETFGQRSTSRLVQKRFASAISSHFNKQRRGVLKILLN